MSTEVRVKRGADVVRVISTGTVGRGGAPGERGRSGNWVGPEDSPDPDPYLGELWIVTFGVLGQPRPPAPTQLRGIAGDGRVGLGWNGTPAPDVAPGPPPPPGVPPTPVLLVGSVGDGKVGLGWNGTPAPDVSPPRPPAPLSLTGVPGDGQVTLFWTPGYPG